MSIHFLAKGSPARRKVRRKKSIQSGGRSWKKAGDVQAALLDSIPSFRTMRIRGYKEKTESVQPGEQKKLQGDLRTRWSKRAREGVWTRA